MGRRGRGESYGNEDYRDLLSARDVLRRQLSIAKGDHARLLELRAMAREKPLELIRRIRNRSLPNIPIRQNVHYVPYVDFSYYSQADGDEGGPGLRPSPQRRSTSRSSTRGGSVPPPEYVKPGDVVRGREFSASKPKTFNQLWTEEEHAKLLQLLEVYPQEAVAAHRWAKIARALGNRTPKQVASRTQKYFAKLKRMGLEPPGSAGSSSSSSSSSSKAKQEAGGETLFQFKSGSAEKEKEPTKEKEKKKVKEKETAKDREVKKEVKKEKASPPPQERGKPEQEGSVERLPAAHSCGAAEVRAEAAAPAVYRPPPMAMDDDDSAILSQVNPDMKDSSTYQELVRLHNLRQEMLASNERAVTGPDALVHDGYGCDRCGADPIVGTRWHCKDCPEGDEVDLCAQCKEEGFESAVHTDEHTLEPVAEPESSAYLDKDYARFSLGDSVETSYLDPQFMPG